MAEPIVYSVEDAARLLGISRTKAYALVREGNLRTIPAGRRQVVPAWAIEALLWTALANRPSFLPPRRADEDDNRVEIVGRLTRDADTRNAKNGRSFCTLRLAVRRGHGHDALFIDVVAFGAAAEHGTDLRKGQLLRAQGRLDQREWTAEDGSRRQAHQIVAQQVEVLENLRSKPA